MALKATNMFDLPLSADSWKRRSADFNLSVTVTVTVTVMVTLTVLVVVPPRVHVFIMTAVPIRIANPPAWRAVDSIFTIFRLPPTSVSIVVAGNAHAMISVRVTALISMCQSHCN